MNNEIYVHFSILASSGYRPGSGITVSYGGALVAQRVKHLPETQEIWVRSLGQEDPLQKGMATHSSILAGEFHGQRNLVGYSL